MFANNWAEMPTFCNISHRILGKEELLGYIDEEVNKTIVNFSKDQK
jgi:hypothetical protein